MRKTLLIAGIAVVLWIAWLLWPLTALNALVRAVQTRNVPAIAEQIDATALRRALTDQLVESYSRVTGANINPGSLIVTFASSAADPLVAKIVAPDGVAVLLHTGWVSAEIDERPLDVDGLSAQALGGAWQVFLNSHRGFDRYSISFPHHKPKAERFQLEWRMRGPKWRLASIRLPDRLAERLVQQIVRVQQQRGG
jgi:hypothetical protein